MRVIQQYRFYIKTKICFAQWPEIVHRFLEENGLTYRRFLYHFSDLVHELEACPKAFNRLRKDCPEIGECQLLPTTSALLFECALTNIGGREDFPEELLLPLMGKIHRSYGFGDAVLCYYDVDFFGSADPYILDGNPAKASVWRLRGSGITLHRDGVFGNAWLDMTIDVLQDGQLRDASCYCKAMQKLLPKVRMESTLKIVLTEEEKQRIAETNRIAQSMLEKCRAFFVTRLPGDFAQTLREVHYSLATAMKKVAKRHGYTYSLVWVGGTCGLEKRTERGNVLFVTADSGPSHTRTEIGISFQGIGFSHSLGFASIAPTSQRELEAMLGQMMEFIVEFERTQLPELDICFPESPAWFEPAGRL